VKRDAYLVKRARFTGKKLELYLKRSGPVSFQIHLVDV